MPNETDLSLYRDSLQEAQATVRAYDTKAQIVGVGYVFALGVVAQFQENIPVAAEIGTLAVVCFWAAAILLIMLFGFVLYPSRKTAPKLAAGSDQNVEHVLYVDPARHDDVDGLKQAMARCDPATELAYEIIKISKLRALKRKRFLRGLFASSFAFLFLFATQMIRV